jgi:hypothetical protein
MMNEVVASGFANALIGAFVGLLIGIAQVDLEFRFPGSSGRVGFFLGVCGGTIMTTVSFTTIFWLRQ